MRSRKKSELQLVRSSSSVGANYRASCRGRSDAEFLAKMGIVEEEADESGFWLELLVEDGAVSKTQVAPHLDEADQLGRIAVASIKTVRRRLAKPRRQSRSHRGAENGREV